MRLIPHPFLLVLPLLAALASGGCAKSPAGTNIGPSLVVTLRFNGPVNALYYYYFLIRNADEQNAHNWPVAVVLPPYAGNGFATDMFPNSGTAAFTDFVLFSRNQITNSGYTLYHVSGGLKGNPNVPGNFIAEGDPDNPVPPGGIDPNTLQFQIALSRLVPPTGECNPATTTCPQARFLQVNAVATTKLPVDPQHLDPNKFTDAFGDQHTGSASFNLAVTVDTTSANTYQSSPNSGDPYYEPSDDTFPGPSDPGIELTAWSIQVRR